uniref:40S ribosomal protein S12 n=141 Tax=Neoaves TaxID=3078114 RepID=A0A674H4V8_TAEGU
QQLPICSDCLQLLRFILSILFQTTSQLLLANVHKSPSAADTRRASRSSGTAKDSPSARAQAGVLWRYKSARRRRRPLSVQRRAAGPGECPRRRRARPGGIPPARGASRRERAGRGPRGGRRRSPGRPVSVFAVGTQAGTAPTESAMAEEGITAGGVMDVNTALQEVLKTALIHDGLARGIREAAKALDKRQAHLCVLASNCDEPTYVKLVEALCAEHQINLIKVDDNKKLGEWVGLCKIDREGKPRKVVGCSCVVVKDYGKESQAKDVIEEYFKCKK